MSSDFFQAFVTWVNHTYPEFSEFGPTTGLPEVMISPHTITIPQLLVDQLNKGCAAIFEETRTLTPHSPAVFTSFDFYITPDGPRLIEINTNAAGALLVHLLTQFHQLPHTDYLNIVRRMFESVAANAGISKIQRIAIVDETPTLQKTHFEFLMFHSLFKSWGWNPIILDPQDLQWTGSQLLGPDGIPIDIVYNRYCDFYLDQPRGEALKQAISAGIPVTPNPQEYKQIADKFILMQLANSQHPIIKEWIPPVIHVNHHDPETLWTQRKSLFFKPAHSFGSKAAYKGERISKKVFQSFWDTDTIAQPYFQAGTITPDDTDYKYDLRVYTFEGKVQLIGARLFQGQLMNFQTVGGGFAAVRIEG